MEFWVATMDSVNKEPHAELTAYMENVVQTAVQLGRLSSDRGTSARFAELLGPEVSRQVVWSWLWSTGGMPRKRLPQLRKLNKSLGISMSDAQLEAVLQAKPSKEGYKPARILLDEVEKCAIECNMKRDVVRQHIAEKMGVTTRTLFRYRLDGSIPPTKKSMLKEAITTLNLSVPDEMMSAVFD